MLTCWRPWSNCIRKHEPEFAKFSTALALSYYLSGIKQIQTNKNRLISGIIILIPTALIMLQPDTGTALVSAAFILVLYREGLSGNLLLIGIAAAVLAVLTLILSSTDVGLPFTDARMAGQYVLITIIVMMCALAYFACFAFVDNSRFGLISV